MSNVKTIKSYLQELLEKRPVDAAGEPVCRCGTTLGPNDFECDSCRKAAEIAQAEKRRAEAAEQARQNALSRGLRTLPKNWDWVDSPQLFAQRVRSKKMRSVAEKYELQHGNLALLGDPGVGKTVAMLCIARRIVHVAVADGHRIGGDKPMHPIFGLHWTSALDLAMARARHPLGQGEAPEIENAIEAPVLALDELGHESMRDPTVLLEILDQRYRAGRTTWLTSGAKPEQLRERYGAGAWRRLLEPKGTLIEDWGAPGE